MKDIYLIFACGFFALDYYLREGSSIGFMLAGLVFLFFYKSYQIKEDMVVKHLLDSFKDTDNER